jgi:dipeptidyl-peptidase 9
MVTAGFLVAIVDGRGSWNRGLGFESSILKKMGSVEVQDQVELVGHLVKVGICDPSHVGIHGWSYGGYMSLMCLAQRPDIFRVCISGAPVTSWEFYDTGYTERYMKTPQSNPEGYKTSSVLNFLDNFPDE